MTVEEVGQVAGILANLENATTKYGLLAKLHDMGPGDLDALYRLLDDWTVKTARIALDEIQTRLRLIQELDTKLRDTNADEVQDLQPLFESSLWIFGPEFESIEYTSNRGMTTVIRELFGVKLTASRQRPDFVIVPEGSVGFYSRDAHGRDHEVNGVSSLVVAEIKKPGVGVGAEQLAQPWRYVKELTDRGLITSSTVVHCFVLGSLIEQGEAEPFNRGRTTIAPMTYDVFIRRAERRMLHLREKLRDAPFLKERGVDITKFMAAPPQPMQPSLRFGKKG